MTTRPLFAVCLALSLLFVPSSAQAAITVVEQLAEAQTADNDASWTSVGTFDIANGATGVCFVFNTDAAGGLTTPTLTGGSVTTWNVTENVPFSTIATPTAKITTFYGLGTGAAAATVTASFSADNQTSVGWNCFELAGAHTSTPFIQDKSGSTDAATSHTVTIDSARSSGSALLFGILVSGTAGFTAEYSGLGTETSNTTPATEWVVQWDIGGSDTTPLWTTSASEEAGYVAVEIAVAAAASTSPRGTLTGVLP